MNKLILLVLSFVTFSSLAGTPSDLYMSVDDQWDIVSELADEISMNAWKVGFHDIEDTTEFLTADLFDEHLSKNGEYDYPLTIKEISDLKECSLNLSCEAYRITLTSSFMAGVGYESHFVMLNTRTGLFEMISQTPMAE